MKKIRLHHYLIRSGLFKDKKEVVDIIKASKVKVNTKIITSPDYHLMKKDKVTFNDKELNYSKENFYVLLNKPKGYLSSRLTKKDIELQKKSVFSLLKGINNDIKKTLFCVGRLDEDTEGLLIITNDGKLSYLLTNPENKIPKVYFVTVNKELSNEELKKMENGIKIDIENNKTHLAKASNVKFGANKREIFLTLEEGKKREIRKMISSLEKEATLIKRISIGKIKLNELKIKKGSFKIVPKEFIMKKVSPPGFEPGTPA